MSHVDMRWLRMRIGRPWLRVVKHDLTDETEVIVTLGGETVRKTFNSGETEAMLRWAGGTHNALLHEITAAEAVAKALKP